MRGEDRRIVLLLCALSIVIGACSTMPRTDTRGTMPPPGQDGQVDPSAMPDFVAVAGDVGRVGWVEKAAVIDGSGGTWPVYGDDLRTVVGQLVPGRGFVPRGADPRAVPTKEVRVGAATPDAGGTGNVMVLFRNCSGAIVWIAVVSAGQLQAIGSAGYWPNGYVGAGDFTVAVGDELVVVDRDPKEPAAAPRQLIYAVPSDAGLVTRWVNIDKAGSATVGSGTPEWWHGVNPPCSLSRLRCEDPLRAFT